LVVITPEHLSYRLRQHLERFFKGRRHEEFTWTIGSIQRSLPRFRVRRIEPAKPDQPWAYVTIGAWEATVNEPHGTEFLLLSPTENPLHVELLAMVANFHADPPYRLAVGHTMKIGRPWIEGSTSDHLLVSPPYPYGPGLEHCYVDGRHIRVLWLVPISTAEAALVADQGLEALEALLEERGVNVLDPTRPSVV
jgi:hypothetical protein